MQALVKLRSFIKSLENRDFYQYCIFLGIIIFLIFGLFFYIFKRKVNYYSNELVTVNKERNSTRKILTDYKLVNQEKIKVEEILSKNKDFILARSYRDVIDQLGLSSNQQEEPIKSTGQIVGDKIETVLKSNLSGLSMKQVTDLLSEIANIDQIYPKGLIITKSKNNRPTVDVDITIATLELNETSE